MRSGNFIVLLLLLAVMAGCGGGGGSASRTLASLAITPVDQSIGIGGTQQFTATGTFSDSTTEDLTSLVTWSSSNTAVATINNNGAAVAVGAGSTTIKALSGNVSTSTTLNVSSATLSKITLSPLSPTIAIDTSQQFTAIGTFTDNTTQDLTSSVTWSSSNTTVATIGNNGSAAAVAAGTTTIKAASGTVSASTTLNVSSATLSKITLQPAGSSVAIGGTQQFAAIGTFTDSTTQDLTSLVTWSSSNNAVATISNTAGSGGAAVALAAGTVTITATMAVTQPIAGNILGTTNFSVVSGGNGGQANVLAITVNGSLCSNVNGSYPNKPCVSVTVCAPGNTSNCQTISDILLDTGSYGLRIFSQALSSSVPLTPVTTSSGNSLAECVMYGDGSSDWGSVQMASVVLGGESAVSIPIQVIDSTFVYGQSYNKNCPNADTSPSEAGFNGILGVGLLVQDCGTGCSSDANNGMYFACSGSACSGTAVLLPDQVPNPVAQLSQDNNGVIVELPGIGANGATSVNGSLVLGIGTQSDNTPAQKVVAYSASVASGMPEFTTSTSFGGKSSTSFIDSGSNALYFYDPNLPLDSSGTWYCPISTTQLSATNTAASGSPSGTVIFQVGNYNTFSASSNNVFNLGGYLSLIDGFDWGLPFFLGRPVYVGFDRVGSSLGTGPYWAY